MVVAAHPVAEVASGVASGVAVVVATAAGLEGLEVSREAAAVVAGGSPAGAPDDSPAEMIFTDPTGLEQGLYSSRYNPRCCKTALYARVKA